MTGATALQKANSVGEINQWKRQEFLSLYPNRAKHIYKKPNDPKWKTLNVPLFTGMFDAAISGQCETYYGAFFGERTRFAVIDIDSKSSRYHNQAALAKLTSEFAEVGLRVILYQSSESKGWHLYIPFDQKEESHEVEKTLKRWLKAKDYVIRSGQLEVFPGGNALRLPLQPGFAWLSANGSLIKTRKELDTDQALGWFLEDIKMNARNWFEAKAEIESQLIELERSNERDAQERDDLLDINNYEDFFARSDKKYQRGKKQELWEKGRAWWQNGLQNDKERHDAVCAVGHYLWYGDEEKQVAALPGRPNAEYRAQLVETWLRKNHNGKCRHINQGKWEVVLDQIARAVQWRRTGTKERPHYPITPRLLKRLIALYKKTGRIWSAEEFEKANQERKEEARERIAEAIASLKAEGKLITIREVARKAKSNWRTVKKNWDLMAVVYSSELKEKGSLEPPANVDLLARAACVINSGGLGVVCLALESSENVLCSNADPISNNSLEPSLEPIAPLINFPLIDLCSSLLRAREPRLSAFEKRLFKSWLHGNLAVQLTINYKPLLAEVRGPPSGQ